jgi:Domain of unknown function (DUF4160)
MPTLFRVGSYRVVVFLNDHRPPHVHVIGAVGRAKFELGATPNDVALVESNGIRATSLRRIAAEIIERHQACLENWKKHHGN